VQKLAETVNKTAHIVQQYCGYFILYNIYILYYILIFYSCHFLGRNKKQKNVLQAEMDMKVLLLKCVDLTWNNPLADLSLVW
jgi:hypothetical protein